MKAKHVKGVPIRPEEVAMAKMIPDAMLDAFNEEIVLNIQGSRSVVQQHKVLQRFLEKEPEATQTQAFEQGWLDVEAIYRNVGWDVQYHKPSMGDSWLPYFEFRRPT